MIGRIYVFFAKIFIYIFYCDSIFTATFLSPSHLLSLYAAEASFIWETNWSGGSNWKHCKIDVVRLEFSGAENVEESWAADEIKKCNFCCTKTTAGENQAWATSHTCILLLSRRAFSEAFLLEISQMYATATTIMKINKNHQRKSPSERGGNWRGSMRN